MEERGFRRLWRRGKQALGVLTANRYTTVAGTLAFFFVLSLLPLLFWLTLLFGRAPVETDVILELELFGWAKDLLVLLKKNAEGAASGASVLFLVATLWSSTGFFYHLRRSGEILYDYRREKKGWRVRVSAVLVTFGVLFYVAFALGALVGVLLLKRLLPRALFYVVEYALLLAIGFFTAWILNGYVCPYRCKPSDTALGSLFTALAWLAASGAFSIYLGFGDKERLYGALTTIVVFLIWLYWMMICFTAGAVYNRRRMRVRGMEHKTL